MPTLVLSALAENGCGEFTGSMDWTGKAGCGESNHAAATVSEAKDMLQLADTTPLRCRLCAKILQRDRHCPCL